TEPPSMLKSSPARVPNWRKDEKSECSVKDKIAMFSSASSIPEKSSNLDNSSITKVSSPSSLIISSSFNKPVTHSSLNIYKTSDSKTNMDRTHSSLDLSYTPRLNYSTLPRKPSGTSSTEIVPRLTRATSFSGPSSLHTRSQSLSDIGRGSVEDMRKASLNALIEQRRRGISKLRGLVIPEKVSEVAAPSPSICDLPEIKSRDSILVKNSYASTPTQRSNISATNRWSTGPCVFNTGSTTTSSTNSSTSIVMPSPPWKASNTNNLPKYSPAFKRKSLTVYGMSTAVKDEPPASLESIPSPARVFLLQFTENIFISVFVHPLHNNVEKILGQGVGRAVECSVSYESNSDSSSIDYLIDECDSNPVSKRRLLQSKPVNSKASDVDLNQQGASDSDKHMHGKRKCIS
ncbi:hypothetical protein L9F63_017512, partial [Diploptera punctata]